MRVAADIAAWLWGLELERYEKTFRENEIDAAILLMISKTLVLSLSDTGASYWKRLPRFASHFRHSMLNRAFLKRPHPVRSRRKPSVAS